MRTYTKEMWDLNEVIVNNEFSFTVTAEIINDFWLKLLMNLDKDIVGLNRKK